MEKYDGAHLQSFHNKNLTVRFAIPTISVIFKNSAAVKNMWSGQPFTIQKLRHSDVSLRCITLGDFTFLIWALAT